jgi:hypothetical protein
MSQIKSTMVNNPVHPIPNPNAKNAFVTLFDDNPERGFIILESNILELKDGFINNKKRTAIINGDKDSLVKLIKVLGTESWGGRIAVLEFTEDNIPDEHKNKLIYTKQDGYLTDEEEGMQKYLKRASKDGVVLTKGGKRIVKFNVYDPSGNLEDILVHHDNIEEVNADRKNRKNSSANN